MPDAGRLRLDLRTQVLARDAHDRRCWRPLITSRTVPAAHTAIIVCDMWDNHWCRGAVERCTEMAPRMNAVVAKARALGVQIIHAPSETTDFYQGTPARERALRCPRVAPPQPRDHDDPPLPIDDSDGGSDTDEKPWRKAWSRQHPAIEILPQDLISDQGDEIYSLLQHRRLAHVVIMGVHTNMCVLHRSFGIKQMVQWGVDIMLARDLTDTMYNPASSPYVSHDEGTRLVVEYIEKFWCPSILSENLTSVS